MMCILAIIVATMTMIDFHTLPFFVLRDKQYFLGDEELFLIVHNPALFFHV